ncbi:MAG: proteasome subunit beta [Myxococcota bacterium]
MRGSYAGASFLELLQVDHPHLLPRFGEVDLRGLDPARVTHGTTVLGLRYADGALVAGDRLATEGMRVGSRDMQKVFPTDDHSLMAIAGAAGPCVEMARTMRVELEHYEKIEGESLELEGKANKLSQMVRQNLPAAMQGLVVVPLFAGYDRRRKTGRLWKYDVTGGRFEEAEFETTGSGGLYAKESLKKGHRVGLPLDAAVRVAIEALIDAADEDRATGGVDLQRGIYPMVFACSEAGMQQISEEQISQEARSILDARRSGAA